MYRARVLFLSLSFLALAGSATHALPPLCSAPGWCESPDLLCSCFARPKVVTCGTYPAACYAALAQPNEKTAACPASIDAAMSGIELLTQPDSR